jgi:5'-nucleotidase
VLALMLRSYGNVTVVAPRDPQSGKSVSLTLDKPLMIERPETQPATEELGSLRVYTLTGTPADCAKLGINIYLHEGRLPDLLVSGINHGSNASAASIYSGTLGAAVEGTLYDIPSVGLSINTHADDPDFEGTIFYGRKVIDWVLADGLKRGIYLNVNVPAIPKDQIRGIRMARQGAGRWVREFDHRVTLRGKHYFWMVISRTRSPWARPMPTTTWWIPDTCRLSRTRPTRRTTMNWSGFGKTGNSTDEILPHSRRGLGRPARIEPDARVAGTGSRL